MKNLNHKKRKGARLLIKDTLLTMLKEAGDELKEEVKRKKETDDYDIKRQEKTSQERENVKEKRVVFPIVPDNSSPELQTIYSNSVALLDLLIAYFLVKKEREKALED
jgi:hypothetical protein